MEAKKKNGRREARAWDELGRGDRPVRQAVTERVLDTGRVVTETRDSGREGPEGEEKKEEMADRAETAACRLLGRGATLFFLGQAVEPLQLVAGGDRDLTGGPEDGLAGRRHES